MRIIRLALTVSALICIAASSGFARESGGHRSSSSSSKSRTSKHSKSARSKGLSGKRKSAAKGNRSHVAKKDTSRLRDTGDIDVGETVWKDLPPEELPSNDPEDADDESTP